MKNRILLSVLYIYALLVSVLRAIRFPSDWAEAHWLMDYRFGITKRGLAGEIFGFVFDKNEMNIMILSAAILIGLYLILLIIALKESCRKQIHSLVILFFVTFFLSQYIVFSAHLIGYLDHLIFLMTVLTVYLIRKKQTFIASLIAAISIFIHEISFFLLVPVSIFILIVSHFSIDRFSFKILLNKHFLKKIILFLALPLFSMIVLFYVQEFHLNLNHAQIFSYLTSFKFISEVPADAVASGFTKSFAYQWEAQSPQFFQRVFASTCTVFYGIPMAFMFFLMLKIFNLKKNLSLLLFIVIISFCPLLLHAIAYDTYRIWTFPFMIMFLIFWILNSSEVDLKPNLKLTVFEICAFAICILLMIFSPVYLFDNESDRFSSVIKIILTLPLIFLLIFSIKKSQIKNLRFFK